MKLFMAMLIAFLVCSAPRLFAQQSRDRQQSEYYVKAYAQHYGVPLALVRAIVQQESNWQPCAVSPKGAVGLMQIMPGTAVALHVTNRCDIHQNISGGVRLLAWLIRRFGGDLRLAVAAYYAGEDVIARKGLRYANRDVVSYVAQVQQLYYRNLGPALLPAR
jgi:soluble lytic murein transglycosylase-like protein